MQRFTSKESVLQENVDTQVQSLSSFQTNSSKGNTLNNQNNFSDKSNILKINSDLATPATSALRKKCQFSELCWSAFSRIWTEYGEIRSVDLDLKSSMHSSHKNSKILELFNKNSIVDLTIDEILTELGNESEIHNGNILLLPLQTSKIFPLHTLMHLSHLPVWFLTKKNWSKEEGSFRRFQKS